MRFCESDEPEGSQVDSRIVDSTVVQDGSAHGAVVLGHKRKRDLDDEGGKGMDIDAIRETGSPSSVAHGDAAGGDRVQSLGGMFSRISIADPEMDQRATKVNESYSNERK